MHQATSTSVKRLIAGSFGTISNWKYNAPQPSVEQFQMQIANNKLGDRDLEPNFMVDCEI